MSDIETMGVTQSQLELEIERDIEEKASRTVLLGVGAVILAWAVAYTLNVIWGVELSLRFGLAAITPLVVFVALRVTYISTFERHSRIKQSKRVAKYRNG